MEPLLTTLPVLVPPLVPALPGVGGVWIPRPLLIVEPAAEPNRPAARPPIPTATPVLSVVVVNYHQWRDTAGLVRQLRTSTCLRDGTAEVVVVDNHASSSAVASRLRRTPGVSLRRWRRNHGFARAVNEGCRLGRGDWLLLLNPDVTLDPGFADAVVALAARRAAAEPRLGVIGFRLRNADGRPQPSTGPFPTLAGTLLRLLLPRSRRKYDAGPPDVRRPVDWATGCCLLIRRECWARLGGLDPDYFLYYEDVDFCRRARAAGWDVAYEPSPSAIHHSPLHARAVPPHIRMVTRHALLTYARKHWPFWQMLLLSGIVRAEAWLRRAIARLRGDSATAVIFRELSRLAAELGRGRPHLAWRRLRRVIRRQEEPRAAPPVGGDSQP